MSKAKREAKKQAKKQKKQASKRAVLKKAKSRSVTKVKKKHWFYIIAPKAFNERILGKSIVPTANSLIGKAVRTNLMELTGDMKKQSSVITFKIINIRDNKAVTRIEKYELMPAAVKRLVRRNKDKIDWSLVLKTRDNVNLRVKPLIMTLNKTKKSVRTAIIKKTEQILKDYFSKNNFVIIVRDIISFKLQSTSKRQLYTLSPVRLFEIKFLGRVIDKKNKQQEDEEVETEIETKEETKVETKVGEKKEEKKVEENKNA